MQRHSSMPTLLLLVLREIRLDKSIHPGQVAHLTGKTPKEWESIETGKSPLTLQVFTSACHGLLVSPSFVMSLAEQLTQAFNRHGWFFQVAPLGKDDELLPLIDHYFASEGYRVLKGRPNDRISVTTLVQGNNWPEPTIVQYCCVQGFKDWVDAGALLEETTLRTDLYQGI